MDKRDEARSNQLPRGELFDPSRQFPQAIVSKQTCAPAPRKLTPMPVPKSGQGLHRLFAADRDYGAGIYCHPAGPASSIFHHVHHLASKNEPTRRYTKQCKNLALVRTVPPDRRGASQRRANTIDLSGTHPEIFGNDRHTRCSQPRRPFP